MYELLEISLQYYQTGLYMYVLCNSTTRQATEISPTDFENINKMEDNNTEQQDRNTR